MKRPEPPRVETITERLERLERLEKKLAKRKSKKIEKYTIVALQSILSNPNNIASLDDSVANSVYIAEKLYTTLEEAKKGK